MSYQIISDFDHATTSFSSIWLFFLPFFWKSCSKRHVWQYFQTNFFRLLKNGKHLSITYSLNYNICQFHMHFRTTMNYNLRHKVPPLDLRTVLESILKISFYHHFSKRRTEIIISVFAKKGEKLWTCLK